MAKIDPWAFCINLCWLDCNYLTFSTFRWVQKPVYLFEIQSSQLYFQINVELSPIITKPLTEKLEIKCLQNEKKNILKNCMDDPKSKLWIRLKNLWCKTTCDMFFLQVIVIVTWINKLQNRTNTKSEKRRAEPNCDFMLVNYKVWSNHSFSNCEEGRRKLIKVIRRPAGRKRPEKLHTLKMLK
jgi:hypothetical protein